MRPFGRKVDGGPGHARHCLQRTFHTGDTGCTGHPFNRQINRGRGDIVAHSLDRFHQRCAVQIKACDLGPFGRKVNRGRLNPRQRL